MSRPSTRLGLAAAIAGIGAFSGADPAAAANDHARGAFSDTGVSFSFKTSFTAVSGPFGQRPAGVARLETTGIDSSGQAVTVSGSGQVTCLDVSGHQAAISVALSPPVTFPNGSLALSFRIIAIDNGFAPSAPTDLVFVGFTPNPSAPAQTPGCEAFGAAPQQDRKGDVVVTDSTQ
jgi:hypothetical protein